MPPDPTLAAAYASATYDITIAGQVLRLRPGYPPENPAALRLDPPIALLTAWNPGGIERSAEANEAAHRELRDHVMFIGWEWYPALNSAADGTHVEPSLGIFGITREAAGDLALRWGQLAFVYWDGQSGGGTVELVWTDDRPAAGS